MATLRLNLSRHAIRLTGWSLLAVNLIFTAGTALFIHEWQHRDWHGMRARWLVDHVLVQFHLATENVVAAWYSSMLLLTVSLAAGAAFSLDVRQARPGLSALSAGGWLVVAATFAGLSLDELGSFHERIGMLHRGGDHAAGWVYVLLIPIAAVGLFMFAFAWVRLRRVRVAAALFALGTALFLSDPIFELAEMSLLRAGLGNDLTIHNALLVVEEGIVELGGALCFLLGVLVYMRATAGEGTHEFDCSGPRISVIVATGGLLLTAGVPAAHWLVARLPPGDTGIPDNWFPAATLYVLAVALVAMRGRRAIPTAVVALSVSAAFGAALWGYFHWYARMGYPGEALDSSVTAVASIAALWLSSTEH